MTSPVHAHNPFERLSFTMGWGFDIDRLVACLLRQASQATVYCYGGLRGASDDTELTVKLTSFSQAHSKKGWWKFEGTAIVGRDFAHMRGLHVASVREWMKIKGEYRFPDENSSVGELGSLTTYGPIQPRPLSHSLDYVGIGDFPLSDEWQGFVSAAGLRTIGDLRTTVSFHDLWMAGPASLSHRLVTERMCEFVHIADLFGATLRKDQRDPYFAVPALDYEIRRRGEAFAPARLTALHSQYGISPHVTVKDLEMFTADELAAMFALTPVQKHGAVAQLKEWEVYV